MTKELKLKPLGDRIIAERNEPEEKTAGGIIVPDTAKEKPIRGKILAVGKGARDDKGQYIPLEVKVGDTIVFGKWAGTEVKIDGKDLLVIKESDIMAIVE